MSPVTGLHITTNTNTAYNLGTQRGVAGGEGGGRERQGIQPRSAFSQQAELEGRHEEEYDVPELPLLLSRQGQRAARAAIYRGSQ